eukprot:6966839-Prymnesium_polylepis.1
MLGLAAARGRALYAALRLRGRTLLLLPECHDKKSTGESVEHECRHRCGELARQPTADGLRLELELDRGLRLRQDDVLDGLLSNMPEYLHHDFHHELIEHSRSSIAGRAARGRSRVYSQLDQINLCVDVALERQLDHLVTHGLERLWPLLQLSRRLVVVGGGA